MDETDLVARVTRLKTTIEQGRDRRARAQAAKEQAEQSLQALLAEHGVTSIEELAQKAADARVGATEMIAAAEAALAL